MGARRRGKGALAPLAGQGWPKIVCFSLFLGKNSIFFCFLVKKKVLDPTPRKIFALPWKKSLRTPLYTLFNKIVLLVKKSLKSYHENNTHRWNVNRGC